MSAGRLNVEKEGAIGWMVIDNPARRNAINGAIWSAIPPAMERFNADPEVRCIVVRGAGSIAFAAGADISEFEKRRDSPDAVQGYDKTIDRALHAIDDSPKPVIAMIQGFCIGGGLELSLDCDLRYAGESSQFAIPAARLGLGYGVHGTSRLVATVGHAVAREIFFTARRYNAQEALRMGFVNRVMPDAELEGFVRGIAQNIAENAPITIAASKALIEAMVQPRGDFSKGEALIRSCMTSEDYVEGRRAFMEKRKPAFKGR